MINVFLKQYFIIFLILKFSKPNLIQYHNKNSNKYINNKSFTYNDNSIYSQKYIRQISEMEIFPIKYNKLNFLYNYANNSTSKLKNITDSDSESWFEKHKTAVIILLVTLVFVIITVLAIVFSFFKVTKSYKNLVNEINNISFKKNRERESEITVASEENNSLV